MPQSTRPLFAVVMLCGLMMSSAANAGVIYSVSALTSDASPLSAVTPGSQIILDITVRTDDFALGVAGSVSGYDNTVVAFNAGASTIASTVLNAFCFPAAGCFGGLENQIGSTIPLQENAVGPGVEVEFLAALALSPAGGNGSIDEGLGGVTGAPQFQLVFDVIGIGSTTFNIGTFAEYLDGYTGTIDNNATNASVSLIYLPEPSTALLVGFGLAGLASRRFRGDG